MRSLSGMDGRGTDAIREREKRQPETVDDEMGRWKGRGRREGGREEKREENEGEGGKKRREGGKGGREERRHDV